MSGAERQSFNCIVFSKLRGDRAAWSSADSWDSGGPIPPGWWFSAVLFSLYGFDMLKVPARCSRRLLLQNPDYTHRPWFPANKRRKLVRTPDNRNYRYQKARR